MTSLCMVFVTTLVLMFPTVDIETVLVGNPGNAGQLAGTGAGGYGQDRICGSVSYNYLMGKYEVTSSQYTAFLNAVAVNDIYSVYDPHIEGIQRGGLSRKLLLLNNSQLRKSP